MSAGRAVIIGLARSGTALARALRDEGWSVLVVDRADTPALRERAASLPEGVEVRLGGYADDVAAGATMLSPSPGVPWDAPELQAARARGIPVRSEIDLVFERCRGRVVGITGTNGKTTTTSLVAAILERAGERVHLGGNIGTPMLDRLALVREGDWVVLELSSFQLETVAEPRCSIGCVLNVTPDHLDRHGSFERYADIKGRLVRFARDSAVLGYDDPVTRAMATAVAADVRFFGWSLDGNDGTTVHDDQVLSIEHGSALPVMPTTAIPMFGRHNVLNVLAAVAMSRAAGVDAETIATAVRAFRPVPHRLETVQEEGGVLWVNDSKATNTESALMALRAFEGRPVIWIGGGKGMAAPMDTLVDGVAAHARHALLIGETAPELDAALAARGYEQRAIAGTLQEAVAAARALAQPGDVVLLAPGFKSFDQFRDFEDRGEVFAELARGRS